MSTLDTIFDGLEETGLTEALVPFILVFVLVFAVLQKSKILGVTGAQGQEKPVKNINVAVALIMALAVIIPHYTGSYSAGADVVDIINSAIPNISVVVVALVMLLLILGIWGNGVKIGGTRLETFAVAISAIAVVLIFANSLGWLGNNLPSWLDWIDDSETISLVIVVLVFGLIIKFITGEKEQEVLPKDKNEAEMREAHRKSKYPGVIEQ
ncbi:MAG: hypothetical protein V1659_04505 [Candidatus Woesearchaeota archaeon]